MSKLIRKLEKVMKPEEEEEEENEEAQVIHN